MPFRPEHLIGLRVQGEQAIELASVHDIADALEHTEAWTVIHDGTPIFCGGMVREGDTGLLWALVSREAGARMLWLTRKTLLFIELARVRSVQTWVRPDFVPACRWAGMLGLTRQELGPYGVDGSNYYRYAREF